MKTPFDQDAALVHGTVDIADSLVPPPNYGVYAIRWPYPSLDARGRLQAIRLILWSCMDRRVIRPLYDRAREWGYHPAEILTLSMAGGPLQIPPERMATVQNVFTRLEGDLPLLQKIWMVAHTQTCGGLKHFCRGRAVAEALQPAFIAQSVARGVDPEMYATQMLLPNAARLLPDSWRPFAEFAVAEPVEATQSVKLHAQWIPTDDAKQAADIFTGFDQNAP